MKSLIQLVSGNTIDADHPLQSEDLNIVSIAHGLSMICRFGGQCPMFYSVAEHSVLTALNCPPDLARAGLMHDLVESIGYCDMVTPRKRRYPDYASDEDRDLRVAFDHYGIPQEHIEAIHQTDYRMFLTEGRAFWGSKFLDPSPEIPSFRLLLNPMSPAQAKDTFLNTFIQLFPEHIGEIGQ